MSTKFPNQKIIHAIFTMLATMLTFSGCQKEKEGIFTATTQSYESSKVHINNNIAYWDDGDHVMINGNIYTVSIDGSDNNKARIEADDVSPIGGYYYAAYPADRVTMSGSTVVFDVPYNESYTTDASGNQLVNNMMVAKSNGSHLAFENVGAMLHFSIKGTGSGIGKKLMAIEVSSDKALAGTFTINMSGTDISTTLTGEPSDTARILTLETPYTLTATAQDFYLNIPEVTGATKFRLRYIIKNGDYLRMYDKTKTGYFTFAKGVIYNFGNDEYTGSKVSFNGSDGTTASIGNAGHPLIITSGEIFSAASYYLGQTGKEFILNNDINVSSRVPTLKATLEGNGHTITLTNSNISLFETIDGGTVKNLTITGTISSPTCSGYRFGALACLATNSAVIENCVNKANITCMQGRQNSATTVGGICGTINVSSSISGCRNEGAITCDARYAGGVVGYCNSVDIARECTNNNAITVTIVTEENKDIFVGGVFGLISLSSTSGTHEASNCHNSGSIIISGTTSNSLFCGGCFGQTTSLATFNVINCSNTGAIYYNTVTSGESYFGGIAGCDGGTNNSTMLNCFNDKAITTTSGSHAGGLLGKNSTMSVKNCYAFCPITATTAAGLVAIGPSMQVSTEISNCYYYGTLTATNSYGIAGLSTSSSLQMVLDYCYYPSGIANICGNNSSANSSCAAMSSATDNGILELLNVNTPAGGRGWKLGSDHIIFE